MLTTPVSSLINDLGAKATTQPLKHPPVIRTRPGLPNTLSMVYTQPSISLVVTSKSSRKELRDAFMAILMVTIFFSLNAYSAASLVHFH